MLNSLSSGRRLAWRTVLWQAVAAVAVGAAFLSQGPREALSAIAGAAIAMLGTVVLALCSLRQSGAGMAFARLLMGVCLKWVVVVGGLILILAQYKLPPLAAIAGLVAAYAVNLLALRFKG